jgi:hypothetical protein
MPSSILACAACVLPFRFILSLWGNSYLPTQSFCFPSEHRSTHYLLAAGLPVKKHFGAVDKIRSVGRLETFFNGPDSSTFGGCCNQFFTLLFAGRNELHHCW